MVGAKLTARQQELLRDNLRAFEANFGEVRLQKEDFGKGFYVFSPVDAESYVQFCYNVDYLNGWLFGCVQGVHKRVKSISEEVN